VSDPDVELLDALRVGDDAAFATLVGRYHTRMLRLAEAFVPTRAVAEEVVQDTWLGVVKGIHRFEGRSSVKTWLFRILVNRCRSVARQRRRRHMRFVTDGLAHETAEAPAEASMRDPGLRDALQSALDALEPKLREAFLLKYGEGLEYREISALTGVGISALKMRVQRACLAMRPGLEAELDG
jgi:RNA polymerase sigma-70 factor (ECF subfamily)